MAEKKNQKSIETILVLVLFMVVVFLFSRRVSWLYAAVAFGLLGLLIPAFANVVHSGWMKLAHALGYVMSRVLLTLIFFLFLLPISLLSKLFTRKSVELKAKGNTYFKERNFTYTPESLENVW